MGTVKSVLGKLGLIFLGISLSILLFEGVVRVWNPPLFDSPLRAYHPQLGWTSKADVVFHRTINQDYLIRFETNDFGFRDVYHSQEAGRNTTNNGFVEIKRIAVIGDSFSESAQVDINQAYWSILGEQLNAHSDHYWEVHNFGVGDYGTVQQLIALEEYALAYRPDIILVQVFPLNDIYNNSVSGANIASNQDAYRPYLNPNENFQSITYVEPFVNKLRQKSYLFRWFAPYITQAFGNFGGEESFSTSAERIDYVTERLTEYGFEKDENISSISYFLFNTFSPPSDQLDMVQEGWLATEAALSRIIESSQTVQATPIIVVVPHIQQMSPTINRFENSLPYLIDPYYAEQRIEAHLEPYGVPTVGLLAPFERNPEIVRPYLEGHFNIATHQFVADILTEEVMLNFPEHFLVIED